MSVNHRFAQAFGGDCGGGMWCACRTAQPSNPQLVGCAAAPTRDSIFSCSEMSSPTELPFQEQPLCMN
jgi:hypothetical protein